MAACQTALLADAQILEHGIHHLSREWASLTLNTNVFEKRVPVEAHTHVGVLLELFGFVAHAPGHEKQSLLGDGACQRDSAIVRAAVLRDGGEVHVGRLVDALALLRLLEPRLERGEGIRHGYGLELRG